MRTIALLLVALLLGAEPVAATAIVAFRSADGSRVILGADSALARFDTDSEQHGGGDCKIRTAGQWFLMSGGVARARDVDVEAVVRAAIAPTKRIAAAMAAIDDVFHRTILPAAAANSYLTGPGFKADGPLLTLMVAGTDRDGVVKVAGYYAFMKTRQPFTVTSGSLTCPGRLCDEPGPFLTGSSMGAGVIPDLLIKQPRPAWLQRADATAARRIIRMQIEATPQYVKAPIDVLELTAAGARWVDRDPRSACAVQTGIREWKR